MGVSLHLYVCMVECASLSFSCGSVSVCSPQMIYFVSIVYNSGSQTREKINEGKILSGVGDAKFISGL